MLLIGLSTTSSASIEVFEKTNLFSSLTAAPNAQRIIRNEQIALAAYSHNGILFAQSSFNTESKAHELSNRQQLFNEGEISRVKDFNEHDCAARHQLLESPFVMNTCLIGSTFPFNNANNDSSGDSGLGCADVRGDLSDGGFFEFVLTNPTAIDGEDNQQNFIIDEMTLDFTWTPPSVGQPEGTSIYWSDFISITIYQGKTPEWGEVLSSIPEWGEVFGKPRNG